MAESLSLLNHIEPVCGAGLAISVAYLNLDRFRYRKEIREHAQQLLERLKQYSSFDIMEHDEKVALIQHLAGLRDNSIAGQENGTNPVQTPSIKSLPRLVYEVIYKHHIDRWASLIFGILCFWGLVLGTMHSANSIHFLSSWFQTIEQFNFWTVMFSLGTVLPLLFVSGGGWIVRSLNKQAEAACVSCEKTLAQAVRKAQVNEPAE